MKNYIAVVRVKNNRIARYQDFNSKNDADTHVATYGGFTVSTPTEGTMPYWIANSTDQTLTHDSVNESKDVVEKTVLTEIRKLESQETPRRLAEALPDDAGGSADGRAWLKANRDKIITERNKL